MEFFASHFPLEHDFFVLIDASFPLLTSLWVEGDRPQEKKRVQPSNGTKLIAPAVEYNHLTDCSFEREVRVFSSL